MEALFQELQSLDHVAAKNEQGNELLLRAGRDGEIDDLEQAIAAYRIVLETWTRERAPLKWAMVQHNLGTALFQIGRRRASASMLQLSIAAFYNAITERTREHFPLRWATTQNNLGAALQTLAELNDASASHPVNYLKSAIEAYRNALGEWAPEREPLDWAMAQNNLGNALGDLGLHLSSTKDLTEAVDAIRSALRVRTRGNHPLLWAITQNNLGTALTRLGNQQAEATLMEEALNSYRASLEVLEEYSYGSADAELALSNIKSLERQLSSERWQLKFRSLESAKAKVFKVVR